MKSTRRVVLIVWLLLLSLALPVTAQGHGGGTPRLAGDEAGPYRIYAWSEPQPLRAGETHLTIGVTTPGDGGVTAGEDETPVTDAEVLVTYTLENGSLDVVSIVAEPQESLGIVYYEADAILPAPGPWQVAVFVRGREGSGAAMFEANVAAARKMNGALIAVVGAPVTIVLLLLAIRSRRHSPAEGSRRAARRNHPTPENGTA